MFAAAETAPGAGRLVSQTQTCLWLTINSFPKSQMFANIKCLTYWNHAFSVSKFIYNWRITIKLSQKCHGLTMQCRDKLYDSYQYYDNHQSFFNPFDNNPARCYISQNTSIISSFRCI